MASRATSIEIVLVRTQSEILHAFRSSRAGKPADAQGSPWVLAGTAAEIRQNVVCGPDSQPGLHPLDGTHVANGSRDIAISFLRLANLDNDIVDRLSRYEGALWRQLVQALSTAKRRVRADARLAEGTSCERTSA